MSAMGLRPCEQEKSRPLQAKSVFALKSHRFCTENTTVYTFPGSPLLLGEKKMVGVRERSEGGLGAFGGRIVMSWRRVAGGE